MQTRWHDTEARYSNISIALHWLIFVLILANANIGGYVGRGIKTYNLEHFQIHKSVGITILVLSLFRLGWRLAHRWPVAPPEAKPWEHFLARGTHILFYVLIIAVPLLGWAAASADNVPQIRLFGAVPAPNLPVPSSHALALALGSLHKAMVNAIYVLLALHVAGALKHHLVDKDEVLSRMLPIARRRSRL